MIGANFLGKAERSKAAVVIVLLLVAALGARGLNADTYWYDEWWSIYNAGGMYSDPFSPLATFARVQQQDPYHPPGYFFLLGAWGGIVGWSEVAARSLSLFGGVLAVAMMYRLGRSLDSRRAGLYAALALGFSAFFITYLHDVRMYSLVPFLAGLGLWAYWRVRQTTLSPVRLVALFLALVAMLYTHYIAGLLALSIGLYHLIVAPKDRRWLTTLLVIGAAGLAFLPWVGAAYAAALVAGDDLTRLAVTKDPVSLLSDLLYLFSNGSIALLIVLAYSGTLLRAKAARFLVFIAILAFLLTVLVNSRFHFVNNIRHVIALFAPLALIVGIGAARTKLAPLMMAIWVAAGVWITFNPAYFVNDWVTVLPWDRLADDLRERAQPGDPLVYLLPDGTPGWMHEPLADYYLHDVPVDPHLVESLPDETPDQYDAQFAGLDDAPYFWVAFDPEHRHSVLAESAVERFVGVDFRACEPVVHRADTTLQLYARATDVALDYPFGDGIALGLIELPPERVESSLRLLLLAAVDPAVVRASYSVGLHVETESGQLVAQTDFGLPDGCYAAQINGLPSGAYRLLVTVYDWQTGERLIGVNAATGAQGDRLLVGTFAAGETSPE